MKKIIKFGLIAVAILLLSAGGGFGALMAMSKSKINTNIDVGTIPAANLTIPSDPESLKEGQRLLMARGCAECHGEDLGGRMFFDSMPLARLYAPNLTAGDGSAIGGWKDEDIARAVRHGVRPSGAAVLFMPAHEFWMMPDAEMAKIIAALRQVPPVDRAREASEMGPVGHIVTALDKMPMVPATLIDHTKVRPQLTAGPTVEYGTYLGASCTGCHGETYSGGPIPGAPPEIPVPSNITFHESGLAKYTFDQFKTLMREGKKADGTDLDPFMPWKNYRHMTDDELTAIWKYLETVPKKPYGGR